MTKQDAFYETICLSKRFLTVEPELTIEDMMDAPQGIPKTLLRTERDTMNNQERANKINEIMAKQKITKAELGRRTGLHKNTIRNLLDGNHTVKYEPTLQRVESALGVKAKSLI